MWIYACRIDYHEESETKIYNNMNKHNKKITYNTVLANAYVVLREYVDWIVWCGGIRENVFVKNISIICYIKSIFDMIFLLQHEF